jgi:myo-inositol 2-dehydrogenase/D-chiro-inositol 1-dehydrogenase
MINIALIGAGGIAHRHAEGLASIDDVCVAAVVDVVPERAAHLAARCGATAYESLAACLPGVDLVYVLTPPSSHRELAVEALRAGVPVLVEKPIAVELADAEAMVEASRETGVPLMVAFNMRFREGFVRLKETVEAGILGVPRHFWSQRLGIGVGPGSNWRTTPSLLCGMSIESLSHDIDLLRWIVGEVVDVRAVTRASHPELPGFDDNAHVVLTLSGGGSAVIHASWSSHLSRNARGVIGSAGTAMVAGSGLWNLDRFHLKTAAMAYETVELIGDRLDVQSYRAESAHFIDCLGAGRRPAITGEDGLAALRVSHAIRTAHRENRVVAIEKVKKTQKGG